MATHLYHLGIREIPRCDRDDFRWVGVSDLWVNPDQAPDGVKQDAEPIAELIESTNQLNDSIKILFDQNQGNDEA